MPWPDRAAQWCTLGSGSGYWVLPCALATSALVLRSCRARRTGRGCGSHCVLSARCTLTYAPSGSATSSLQGSPHYRLRPAATLRSLTGLPLYWDAISPVGRTAQWRGGQQNGGQGRRSGAQAGACARSPCGRMPPHWAAGVGIAHQTPPGVPPPPHTALRFVRPFPPVLKRPGTVHDGACAGVC